MTSFYAVAIGIKPGVYMSWNDCKAQIENFDKPVFKKFASYDEATDFLDDYLNYLYVYTDGSCINNGEKYAKAGIGIYFSKDNPNNLSLELDNTKVKLTNNIAEIIAVIKAIKIIKSSPIPNKIIVTDSEYVIKCATTYGEKLEKNNWKTSNNKIPPNLELIQKLYILTNKYNIKYKHILSHTANKDRHSIGNYYADLLANKAINNTNNNNLKIDTKINKIYLNVSYQEKDNAKEKGAKWDATKKKWYIYENNKNKEELIKKYP